MNAETLDVMIMSTDRFCNRLPTRHPSSFTFCFLRVPFLLQGVLDRRLNLDLLAGVLLDATLASIAFVFSGIVI